MERQQRVAAVILAAGESRRFGSAKQVARLGERTLLEHVLTVAQLAKPAAIVAVVPPWLELRADAPKASLIRNDRPELGMSHSLRLGIGALPDEVEAAVILLGDQPTLRPEAVRALVAARGSRPIVATRAAGRMAAPVLVERSHFNLVETLSGDIGLREVIAAHDHLVLPVDVPQHAPDVDTPADLQALRDG